MPKMIATKTISGEIHLFDCSKHESHQSTEEVKPDLRLLGHSEQGFGLDWSP
jgi:histone-binding protein RBBP4